MAERWFSEAEGLNFKASGDGLREGRGFTGEERKLKGLCHEMNISFEGF
jgi:hypothetical protein